MALVALPACGGESPLVGVSRYEPADEEDTAEVAIVVHDRFQRRGLGAMLLDGILRAGEANGIRQFRAHLLASNRRALAMLSRLTSIGQVRTQAGITTVQFVLPARLPAATKYRRSFC
jgi:acetyltransferase